MTRCVEWRVEPGLTDYLGAVAFMEARAAAIHAGDADELIWLVEHPPLYTAGTSANDADVLRRDLPIFATGRGGRHTYHGPGQRVVYVMLDLNRRGRDVRRFVGALEAWIIATLESLEITAFRVSGRVGVWTGPFADPAKLAAIGVRIRRWITLHGFSVNVDPDLRHFAGIVPCGIADAGVTSIAVVRGETSLKSFDLALRRHCCDFLAATRVEAFAMTLEQLDYLV